MVEDTSRVILDVNVMPTDEFARTNREIYGTLDHHVQEIPVEANEHAYQKVLADFSRHIRKGTPLLADGWEGP